MATVLESPGIGSAAVRAAVTELCTRSLHTFYRRAWPYFMPDQFLDNWHIGLLAEHLEAVSYGQIEKLLINIPPGCSKTSLVGVAWPCWEWASRPEKAFMYATYAENLTKDASMLCRKLLRSEWYQRRWGHKFAILDDQDEKLYYANSEGGWRFGTSIGGSYTGKHPHYRIVDDPHKVLEAESEAERVKVIDFWDQGWSTRGVGRGARDVVIMQRISVNDLTAHILKETGWEVITLPMYYEPDRMRPTILGGVDIRTEEGELLHPAYMTPAKIATVESRLGEFGRAGQLQQRPHPKGGIMFSPENFGRKRPSEIPATVTICRYWDKAGSLTKGSSATAGPKLARDHRGRYYVMDMVRGRWLAPERNAKMKNIAKADAAKHGNIVHIVTEREGGSGGKESAAETIRSLAAYPVSEDLVGQSSGNKETRAQPLANQCEAGNVFIVTNEDGTDQEWVAGFEQRMSAFPRGENDEIDALAGAYNFLAARVSANVTPDKIKYYRTQGEVVGVIDQATGKVIQGFAINGEKCYRFGVAALSDSADGWSCLQLFDYWTERDMLFLRYSQISRSEHAILLDGGVEEIDDDGEVRHQEIRGCRQIFSDLGATKAIVLENEAGSRLAKELPIPAPGRRPVQGQLVAGEEFVFTSLKRRLDAQGLYLPADEEFWPWRRQVESAMLSWTDEEPEAIIQALAIASAHVKRLAAPWGGVNVTSDARHFRPRPQERRPPTRSW